MNAVTQTTVVPDQLAVTTSGMAIVIIVLLTEDH